MEVILFENVPNLGTRGSTVKVAPGYFRNFLSPRGFAVEATKANVKALRDKIARLEKIAQEELKAARSEAEKLSEVVLTFTRKSAQEGKLFGSVTNVDIAEKLAEAGYTVDRHYIVLSEPIKRVGTFEAIVKMHHEVNAAIKVIVESENEVIVETPVEETVEATPVETPAEEAPAETPEDAPAE